MALNNPTDLARETLKLLSQRKIAPSPENYQRIYHEIAGTKPDGEQLAGLQAALRESAKANPTLEKTLRQFETALSSKNWKECAAALGAYAQSARPSADGDNRGWGELIRELIRQWEAKHAGLTAARKRETLERVLINFGNDSTLPAKLQGMLKSWGETPTTAAGGIETAPDNSDAVPPQAAELPRGPLMDEAGAVRTVRDLLVQTLESGVVGRLAHAPELAAEGRALIEVARTANKREGWEKFSADLRKFWFKLELQEENEAEVSDSLLRLLRLMMENIGELVEDDQWLQGQIGLVREVIAQPFNVRMIEDAERSFKEVIFKQGALKHSLGEAKATLKNMISVFVERLGEVSVTTSEYHDKVGSYMEQISQTEDVPTLNRLLDTLMNDTRSMQVDMMRSRDEMTMAQRQAEEAEQKIRQLEKDLAEVSSKVREDQLTGILNRRGLEDAMERELARADRHKNPLCLAVLDLDNFKRLNDTYGHQTGDEALVHLTKVIKHTVRPTDVVARYGGEEFVIILPETPIDEANKVITRLQRELTKRFFLHDNERLLITFSAGIAVYSAGEPRESIIKRADQAMYQAKQQGKNRVVNAPNP